MAFVIDAFARRIVGWRVVAAAARRTSCWTPWNRRCMLAGRQSGGGLVHHSDRGVQYVSIRYTERLVEAGDRTFGRQRRRQLRQCARRDHQRPLQGRGHPSTRPMAQLSRRSNSPRSNGSTGSTIGDLLEPIGNIPPAEAEARYYAQADEHAMAA